MMENKKKKMFLVRPIAGISDEYREEIEVQIEHLRITYDVYDPLTQTDQNKSELRICKQNREAMESADVVGVIWDLKSHGCLFDLGMAFAMKKRIEPVTGYFPAINSSKKTFQNMVWAWELSGACDRVEPTHDGKPLECPECHCRDGFLGTVIDTGDGWGCYSMCPECNHEFDCVDYPFGSRPASPDDFEAIGWEVIDG